MLTLMNVNKCSSWLMVMLMWMASGSDPDCEINPESCQRSSCGLLPQVKNAKFVGEHPEGGVFDHEAVAEFACHEGHSVDGLALGPRKLLYRCHSDGLFKPVRSALTECKPVKCGAPFELPYAFPTSHKVGEPIVYPQRVNYSCHEHHTANGENDGAKEISIVCGSDGKFQPSYPLPRCQPIHCGEFPNITNAEPFRRVHKYRVEEGQGMDYVCLNGFTEKVLGFEIKCVNIDGIVQWDIPARTPCVARKCGQLEHFSDAEQTDFSNDITYRYPSKVPFACESGYALGGDKNRHTFTASCSITGIWEYDRGKDRCEPVICGDINDVPGEMKRFATAVIAPKVMRLGDKMEFACDEGAYVAGSDRKKTTYAIECSNTGDFKLAAGHQGTCMKPCGPLLPMKSGKLLYPAGVKIGQVVESPANVVYTCEQGHTLGGVVGGEVKFSQQCHPDGNLSPEAQPPACELVKCGHAPAVPHGERLASGESDDEEFVYEDEVKYTCSEGMTHNGVAPAKGGSSLLVAKCGVLGWGMKDTDGRWSKRDVQCQVPRCQQKLPAVPNAAAVSTHVVNGRLALNGTVEYKCNVGFALKDQTKPGIVSCNEEGDLTIEMDNFECAPLVCPLLPTIMYHGTLHGPPAREPYKAPPRVYQCPDRWTPDKVEIQCGLDGEYHAVGPRDFRMGDPKTTRYPMCHPPSCKASDIPPAWTHISLRSRAQTGDFIYGTSYKIKCQQGFGTANATNMLPVRCNENSQWEIDGNPEDFAKDGYVGCTERFTGTGEYIPEIWPPPVLYG